MKNDEMLTFFTDMVKGINNSYIKYYHEMSIRGLPLEFDNFGKGMERALTHKTKVFIRDYINLTNQCDECGYKQIVESLKKVWGDPIK